MTRPNRSRRSAASRILWLVVMACAEQETTSCPTEAGTCSGGYYGEYHSCVALEVNPGTGWSGSAFLVGDTLRMSAFSDSGFAVPVIWAISGAAAVIVPGSAGATGAQSFVVIKGVQPGGTATVTATHLNPTRSATSTLRVADSSAITKVAVSPDSTSVKVGTGISPSAALKDASGAAYSGKPQSWSSSDTTVAVLETYSNYVYVRGKKAGSAVITATFLSRQGSMKVTVVP